jgi:hypothetical protein
MSGDEKVVEAQNHHQIVHDVAVPGDEPTEAKYHSQFGSIRLHSSLT